MYFFFYPLKNKRENNFNEKPFRTGGKNIINMT